MDDQLYREYILEHYKHPHNHGSLEQPDMEAHDLNPLCGDELTFQIALDEDGKVKAVAFDGHGCAISQAATSMLTEMVKGRKAADVAALPKDELLEEIGIPLTPIRLKCALLGLCRYGLCPGAQERFASGQASQEHDVRDDGRRLRHVSAGQKHSFALCQGQQTIEESLHPNARQGPR